MNHSVDAGDIAGFGYLMGDHFFKGDHGNSSEELLPAAKVQGTAFFHIIHANFAFDNGRKEQEMVC